MAVTLNANTSTGFIATSDTSGVLQLQTGGTAAVTVDASQNVGIGTASPAGKLHVAGSGGPLRISGSGYATNPTEFTLGQYSSTIGYLQIPGGSTGRIDIWDGGTAPIAIFNQYGMGLYGTTPTSGSGITFPATQQASSNVNTLDDYEEGSWTPALTFTSGSVTYTSRTGVYTKVGNLVVVQCQITVNTASSPSGQLTITGLPFAPSNSNLGGVSSCRLGNGSGTFTYIGGEIGTTPRIYFAASTTSVASQADCATMVANGFYINVGASYLTS